MSDTLNSDSNSNSDPVQKAGIHINYYRNPVLARYSVAQLLLRPGLMGFSNLVWVSGDWRGLSSPFCRLGRENPVRLICEPEFVRQESENASLSAAFCSADSIAIDVISKIPQKLYGGAPGKIYHNGGTAQQQWMAFDAFRDGATLEQIRPGVIMARNGDYCGVFIAAGLELAHDGNGWSAPIETGRFFMGVGVALRNPELAEERAKKALSILMKDGGIEHTRERLREEWRAIFDRFQWPKTLDAELISLGENAAWCMFSNLAAIEGYLTRPSILASKIQYPGLYPWDTAFAAVAIKEAAPDLAKDQIEVFTDQLRDSATGEAGEMTALHSGGGLQFPLFSWAAWRVYQAEPDVDFLSRIYDPLAKHAAWWLRPAVTEGGIPFYPRVMCLDDSPRFDMFSGEGRMSLKEPVFGADLITICALDQLYLACMAEALNRNEEAQRHREIAGLLSEFAENELYDEKLGRYVDIGVQTGQRGIVNTPLNHFPAMLSPSQERRLRAGRALSPDGPFWGKFGLATVSPEECSFDPCRIWRGPIWFNVNYLCAEACWQMGYPEVAEAIASSSMEILRANAPLPNGVMEYYNYLTGEGTGAQHFATLGAASFLSLLLGHYRELRAEERGFPIYKPVELHRNVVAA